MLDQKCGATGYVLFFEGLVIVIVILACRVLTAKIPFLSYEITYLSWRSERILGRKD